MELGSAIFFVLAIVLIGFAQIYLQKYMNPKRTILASLVTHVLVIAMFVSNLFNRFSFTTLAIVCVGAIAITYSFYSQYRKYKKENPPAN
jgi:O-antigen/teichoic acid export membrane protein